MMIILKRWKVTVTSKDSNMEETSTVLYIHDNFYGNMLRKLAEIGFEDEPVRVLVEVA